MRMNSFLLLAICLLSFASITLAVLPGGSGSQDPLGTSGSVMPLTALDQLNHCLLSTDGNSVNAKFQFCMSEAILQPGPSGTFAYGGEEPPPPPPNPRGNGRP